MVTTEEVSSAIRASGRGGCSAPGPDGIPISV